MVKILGINAYHGDSSACLVIDGKLVNAIEEERIRRIKHWAGLPSEAIKWCIQDSGISIGDIDYIAIARNPSANISTKLFQFLTKPFMFKFLIDRIFSASKAINLRLILAKELGVDHTNLKAKIVKIEHHRAHIASAFYVSPFEEAACLTVDGFGDFVSTMRAIGKGNKIEVIDSVKYPHSLGIFYTALTQYLGFWKYGDEYKVMGLSAYGNPVYLDKLKEIVRVTDNGLFELSLKYFTHDKYGVEMSWHNGEPDIKKLFSNKLEELLGPARKKEDEITQHYKDIALAIQETYENIFFHMLNALYIKTGQGNLILAGGCIQNSLANGKIKNNTQFKNIYIPPTTSDAGLAVGAAMFLWNQVLGNSRKCIMDNPYLGPSFTKSLIEGEISRLSSEIDKSSCNIETFNDEDDLCKKAADLISKGKIVGWFQGRTEWGPRALGNRSILADPRMKNMKEILNKRIKRRESFRPFAPSILEEKVTDWFENADFVPFMEKVYVIKTSKRQYIPAVCHEDGTGRLQTVSSKMNLRYYKLIKNFDEITGIPMVLNTSFNDNEPIVNTPSDALKCFLSTQMDNLIIGDFIITKNAK